MAGAEPPPDLKQFGFQTGIGVEQYCKPYIEQASTNGTNRTVVIEKSYKTIPSLWLTMNAIFDPNHKLNVLDVSGKTVETIKYGFFVGVKVVDTNGNALSGFALGPQMNFIMADKRLISLGIGLVNHRTKELASGIVAGQPLPEQYTDVKYRENSEYSGMLMLSVNI